MFDYNCDIKNLREQMNGCKKCNLAKTRRNRFNPLLGVGHIPAKVIFINESPSNVQEILNKFMAGVEILFLIDMIHDAAKDILNETPTYFITNMVCCQSIDEYGGFHRTPKSDEVLKCKEYMVQLINILKPEFAVFLSKDVEHYHKTTFRDYITLQSMQSLISGGGRNHPNYITQLIKLKELFLCLEN